MDLGEIDIVVSTHSRPKAAGEPSDFGGSLYEVSTHSRPKAAGDRLGDFAVDAGGVSTHSRPKAAGNHTLTINFYIFVSTHSRPKAAGNEVYRGAVNRLVSTHSRPKAAGPDLCLRFWACRFQHTAARRRLDRLQAAYHSDCRCFNTQPPEGGWPLRPITGLWQFCFNTQPPEGGW